MSGYCEDIDGVNNNTDPDTGNNNTDPDSGNTDPDTGNNNTDPDSGNTDPDSGNTDPDSGNTDPDSGTSDADSGNTDPDSGNTDPDSGNTDADSGTTDADSGTSDADSGTSDADSGTSDADSGTSDADSGTSDADSGTSDADSGTPDGGTTTYSGCSSDFDCDSYQTCNTSFGRCEDARTQCSDSSDCAYAEDCFDGRCVSECSAWDPCDSGLSCVDAGGSSEVCLALCDGFVGSSPCGPDTQCVPYFGADFGLCRGVGAKTDGQTCETDFSTDACAAGSLCTELRNDKTCQPLCAASGSPGCATGEFCHDYFEDTSDSTNNAGTCMTNCGGLGNTDDTLCATGQACHPISTSEGICITQGTVQDGGTCAYEGSPYCETGLACVAAGADGATDPVDGACRSYCDPLTSSNSCGSGQSCYVVNDAGDFGLCQNTCDPALDASANACTTERPRCLPDADSGTPTADGRCSVAGNLATGAGCSLEDDFECNPDSICAINNSTTEPYGGGSSGSGNCTRYCVNFDYGSTSNRCNSGEVCAVRYLGLGLGFCTSNTTSSPLTQFDSCSSSESGSWCDDDTLCDDWFGGGSYTCEIPCDTQTSGTCPSGQSCLATSSGSTSGICQ